MADDLAQIALNQEWRRLETQLLARPHSVEELTGALIGAVYCQNLEMTRQLLEAGANPNRSFDGSECPAMTTAVEQTWQSGLELLIAHGGMNVRKYGGWTPLLHAVDTVADRARQVGTPVSLDLLRFLLAQGADPSVRDDQGLSAADVARLYHWEEAAQLLAKAEQGPRINP
ncbi:ankyrin repeat domain-containing protein [Deinococcus malanensis]|uniref:ankyrin repeat domain-containing protein n=1 Tax=Deinococcus malanensis TaxID=1706855 RepID=UPI003625AA47